MTSKNSIVANALNSCAKNERYNPSIAYDHWNNYCLPHLKAAIGGAKKIKKILEHNAGQDMTYAEKVDNDNMLSNIKRFLDNEHKLYTFFR